MAKDKINYDELADLLIADYQEVRVKLFDFKGMVEGFIQWLMERIRARVGALPDEEAFIQLLAVILDKAIKLGPIMEIFDGMAIKKALQLGDSILDKIIGKDWYERLRSKIETTATVSIPGKLDTSHT